MKTIRLEVGALRLEVISDDVETDLKIALATLKSMTATAAALPLPSEEGGPASGATARGAKPHSDYDHGINTYVAKLGGDSGRKLIRAASFHLSLVDGLESFPKDALIARAREAREWKKDYVNTQATDLRRMVASGDLIERSNGQFTVPTKALEEGKALLSQ